MKRVIVGFLVISFGLFLKSCNSVEPPPDGQALTLKLEDVSCTEAWITLTTTNLQLPATLTLRQINPTGDTVSQILNLNTQDSLLYIDSLLPNKSYQHQVSSIEYPATSNEIRVTTMDTTSHAFTWQTFVFGEQIGSVLFDVAVIDENNIWAVGAIYMTDSVGQAIGYNAVHWDGQNWELKRILYAGNIWSIKSVFAINENDIWFSAYVRYYNGNFIELPIPGILMGWEVNKIWGNSSNDFYVVGTNGNIVQYDGSNWRKIYNNTDVNLQDINGTSDGNEVWTCGWSNQSGRVSLLKIMGSSVESIWDSQTNTTLNTYRGTLLNSLWANGNGEFVLVGGQVLRHSLIDKKIVRREWVPYLNGSKVLELGNYAYRIKGSNKNNIVAAGDAAMIWHYNGSSWYKFEEVYNQEDRLYGLVVTDNLIVAVGKRYSGLISGALILVGRR
ncbi:MAG: glucosyl transferase [Ignavibacteriaceae bacterium]